MSRRSFRSGHFARVALNSAAQLRGVSMLPRTALRADRSAASQPSILTAGTGTVRCWLLRGGTTMPRTDDDSWDITESVGSTALGVAAARAAGTNSDNPLLQDPVAQGFLDAAGEGMWSLTADPKFAAQLADVDPELPAQTRVMVDFMAVRTAWYDQIF